MENSAFRRAVCSDSAENSIMQTITIAVSAILIASGLVTAPGLINNARDNNSRSDLANSAYAEETMLAVEGTYWAYDNYVGSEYRKLERPGIEGSVNLTVSTSPRLIVDVSDDGKKWMGTSYSSSGKVFIRSSESAETVQVDADTFKSLAAPLAGEELVIEGANGKKVIVPQGLTLSDARNMHAASVEDKPYFFGTDQLPGFGKPIYVGAPSTGDNPDVPEENVPNEPATNVSEVDKTLKYTGWSASVSNIVVHKMQNASISITSSDADYINSLAKLREKEPESVSQSYPGAPVMTTWRYTNPEFNVTPNTPIFKVSLVEDNGNLVTATWVRQVYLNQSVSQTDGRKTSTIGISPIAYDSKMPRAEFERLIAKKEFVLSIDGYDYYFKG